MARRCCMRVLRVNAGRIGLNKKSSYDSIRETNDEFAHRCQFAQTATSRLIAHSERCRAESRVISQSTLAKSAVARVPKAIAAANVVGRHLGDEI